MAPLLLDSNAFSFAVDPKKQHWAEAPEVAARIAEHGAVIPVVVYYEIERGLIDEERAGQGSARRREFVRRRLTEFTVLPFNVTVALVAAELWSKARGLKPAKKFGENDLMVAATAITHDLRLLTYDQGLRETLSELGRANILFP